MNWTEWKRNEDEPRRRIRIDLQAAQRALTDVLDDVMDFGDLDWLDICPPQTLPGEVDDNPMSYRELIADDLARVHTRLDEIDAVLHRMGGGS